MIIYFLTLQAWDARQPAVSKQVEGMAYFLKREL